MNDGLKTCFVISPIGKADSSERKRADTVLKHIISPAAEQCGYNVIRADKISKPGIITVDILRHLVGAELVIADLTNHNPNVFYELAVRHVSRRPVISIMNEKDFLPFDVSQSRTILFNEQDLDSAISCRDEIIRQIAEIESSDAEIPNPISIAMNFADLERNDNHRHRETSEIASTLNDFLRTLAFFSGKRETEALSDEPIIYGMYDMLQSPEQKRLERESVRLHKSLNVLLWTIGAQSALKPKDNVDDIVCFEEAIQRDFLKIEFNRIQDPSFDELLSTKKLEIADIVLIVVFEPNFQNLEELIRSKSWLRRKLYVFLPTEGAKYLFSPRRLYDQLPDSHIRSYGIDFLHGRLCEILINMVYAALVTEERKG